MRTIKKLRMKHFIKYSFILLISITFISCKRCPKNIPKHDLPQEFKDYAVFPSDSWWVYEDSASGLLDTIKLLKFNTDYRNCGGIEACPDLFYIFNGKISSSFNDSQFVFTGGYNHCGKNAIVLQSYLGYFIYDEDNTTTSLGNYISKINYLDTYVYNQITYTNIYKIGVKFYNSSNTFDKIYYWAKFVGPINIFEYSNDSLLKIKYLKTYHINN